MDSGFHDLESSFRFGETNILKADVIINNNVFMGNNATFLKDVTISENSVVDNGLIVSIIHPR
jgi:acetyltransferase-like isoleucine patch superfamily enzyme